MGNCPTYLVPFASQLKLGGRTGPFDCTAWAASRVIGASTCGHTLPSGRTIRLLSNEPNPSPSSPGLNLIQVADVAIERYGVYLDVRIGGRALDWDEYERSLMQGRPAIVQINYGVIADSKFDAGRGFRGGHAIAETQHATYDSLADGRANGVWKFDGRLYPRELIREAAAELLIAPGVKVGKDNVWCAIGRDTAPAYAVTIQPRKRHATRRYRDFQIASGSIGLPPYVRRRTNGLDEVRCGVPRAFKDNDGDYRFLVEIREGARRGQHVALHWAKELK